jgi:hypothetical protein
VITWKFFINGPLITTDGLKHASYTGSRFPRVHVRGKRVQRREGRSNIFLEYKMFSDVQIRNKTYFSRVCVECLIGKQKKPILFKVTEPSSIPYRTHPACAKMAAYPDPPPVIPLPDTGVAQAAYAETLLPGSAPARNVFRYWGSPRACYRIPCCE